MTNELTDYELKELERLENALIEKLGNMAMDMIENGGAADPNDAAELKGLVSDMYSIHIPGCYPRDRARRQGLKRIAALLYGMEGVVED